MELFSYKLPLMLKFPIFEKLGGETAAISVLQRRRKKPGEWAVRKWKTTRAIPAWAEVALMQEALERGIKVARADFEVVDV